MDISGGSGDLNVVSDVRNKKLLHVVSTSNLKSNVRFKVVAEAPPSGKCGTDYTFMGCDVYLTAKACVTISNSLYAGGGLLTIGALVSGGSATVPLGIAAGCAAIGGAGFSELANQYPEGCVISFLVIPGLPPLYLPICIPYSISGR